MIKPQELRIGNLVEWVFPNTEPKGSRTEWIEEREIVKIESIRQELVGLKGSAYGWHQIQGIPITEEWLLKFGLKRKEDGATPNYRFTESKAFYLGYAKFGDRTEGFQAVYFHGKFWGRIKYVHQLQNLFFALTGEELTIK